MTVPLIVGWLLTLAVAVIAAELHQHAVIVCFGVWIGWAIARTTTQWEERR